jgi:hypothetical protein
MPKLSGHAGQNIRTIHLRWIVRWKPHPRISAQIFW